MTALEVRFATRPSPGGANEDAVVAGEDYAVVLDGATAEPDTDSGCGHGVRWFATELAARLGGLLGAGGHRDAPLTEVLLDACAAVGRAHGGTCDLTNICSPSATVAVVRATAGTVEYLVLGDATVALRMTSGEVRAVTDQRILQFDDLPWEKLRYFRNVADGFWVAGAVPEAARHALTGAVPEAEVDRVALLSDGAARLVERYGWSWDDLLDELGTAGPAAVIARTRVAESGTPGQFDGKHHDDATAVLCTIGRNS